MNDFVYALILVIGMLIGFIIKSYLPSYFKEKGKNLATKEDISEITRLQEEVKSTFQSSLEEQRSELNGKLEVLKHQQNKLLKDYELYTVKRFEYYPELYKEIESSISEVSNLKFKKSVNDFRNFNSEDIDMYVTNKFRNDELFTSIDKQRIISRWDTNQQQAIKVLQSRIRMLEYNQAGNSYVSANNYYILHRLFFSEKVIQVSKELLDTIHELWKIYMPYAYDFGPDKTGETEKQKIDVLIKELFHQMKSELSNKHQESKPSS
ncbi:hypothetical protein AAB109_29740 (plasmid) [Priestia megaterium]|uniref:hypothetical protein n=1 Tax=Priestia megaterium TaxID=1404 RepID=UPI0030F4289D